LLFGLVAVLFAVGLVRLRLRCCGLLRLFGLRYCGLFARYRCLLLRLLRLLLFGCVTVVTVVIVVCCCCLRLLVVVTLPLIYHVAGSLLLRSLCVVLNTVFTRSMLRCCSFGLPTPLYHVYALSGCCVAGVLPLRLLRYVGSCLRLRLRFVDVTVCCFTAFVRTFVPTVPAPPLLRYVVTVTVVVVVPFVRCCCLRCCPLRFVRFTLLRCCCSALTVPVVALLLPVYGCLRLLLLRTFCCCGYVVAIVVVVAFRVVALLLVCCVVHWFVVYVVVLELLFPRFPRSVVLFHFIAAFVLLGPSLLLRSLIVAVVTLHVYLVSYILLRLLRVLWLILLFVVRLPLRCCFCVGFTRLRCTLYVGYRYVTLFYRSRLRFAFGCTVYYGLVPRFVLFTLLLRCCC
jgi:hypothetical protein